MIAHISIANKGFGDKQLYKELDIRVQAGEKIGLVGRNGTGESKLFNLMDGIDKDFDGEPVKIKETDGKIKLYWNIYLVIYLNMPSLNM